MSTVRKTYFERVEGGEIMRVRNRIQAKKGKKKIETQIGVRRGVRQYYEI